MHTARLRSPVADAPITIVGIPGSLRDASRTRAVVGIALEGAAEVGAHTQLIDLRGYDLPFQDGSDEVEEHPDVLRLRQAVGAAHGIILGTPEYHAGYSGVLKNALDLMGFDEFEGKMMGLVGVAGGALGASNALNDLRNVGRSLHAWVVPEQAGVPRVSANFDAEGHLTDDRLAERVREVGRQVARFTLLHTGARWQDFLREWQAAPTNPGGMGR